MSIRRSKLALAEVASAPSEADQATLAMDGFVTVRVVQLAEMIRRGSGDVFERRFGVRNTELRILVRLGGHAPLAVSELARRTRVDKAWISRSLRGLERRGLVRRAAHPTDSRASLVFLTDKGQALVDRVAPVAEARHRRLLAGLDETEVHRVLDALFANADEILRDPDLTEPAPAPGSSRS